MEKVIDTIGVYSYVFSRSTDILMEPFLSYISDAALKVSVKQILFEIA